MRPEKQNIIGDLLDGNATREATLLAGAAILRRRRHWRAVTRGVGALTILAIAVGLILKKETPPGAEVVSVPAPTVPAAQVRAMSDEELLALFPGTPVALASLPDGKKRLIFPRPGDEQKFITRL